MSVIVDEDVSESALGVWCLVGIIAGT